MQHIDFHTIHQALLEKKIHLSEYYSQVILTFHFQIWHLQSLQ